MVKWAGSRVVNNVLDAVSRACVTRVEVVVGGAGHGDSVG